MSQYENAQRAVSRQLAKYGKAADFSRESGTAFDSTTGTTTSTGTTSATVQVLERNFTLRDRATGLVEQGDRNLMVEAAGFAPAPGDTVAVDGKNYTVVQSEPVNPGGLVLYYNVQVRG